MSDPLMYGVDGVHMDYRIPNISESRLMELFIQQIPRFHRN